MSDHSGGANGPPYDAGEAVQEHRDELEPLADRDDSEAARKLAKVIRGVLARHNGGDD